MLDKVARKPQPHERLAIGSKSLSLDPVWAQPPIADIEVALLRHAAFPELTRDVGGGHEFVIVDPSTSPCDPSHEDLALRISDSAARLKIQAVVVGNAASDQFGGSGFPHTVHQLAAMPAEEFARGVAQLRERVAWVLSSARFSRQRHLLFPACDATLYAVVVDLVAQLPAAARPFVHLATWWDAEAMPNAARFPALERVGSAINLLNAARPTTFLYAWSRPLAQRLSTAFGQPVAALDAPPELALASPGEPQPDRFTVGYFSAPSAANGFDLLPEIVRATNRASGNPRRTRFVIQVRPPAPGERHHDRALARRAELAALPDRNVSLIDDFLPRPLYFAVLKQVDAVLLPLQRAQPGEQVSAAALHAMAAGKLVATFEQVRFAGTARNRVLSAPDPRALGELIADAAQDIGSVRIAARVAKSTWWATLRPSRLFAQLLYGPLILAGAAGSNAV